MSPVRAPRSPRRSCKACNSTRISAPPRGPGGAGHESLVELEPGGAGAAPPDRPPALAHGAPESHRAAPRGAALPAGAAGPGPRLPGEIRPRPGVDGPGPHAGADLVRAALPPPAGAAGGLLLRRVRTPQLGADLQRRPRRAGRRSLQERSEEH